MVRDACCWCFEEMEITENTYKIIGSKTESEWYVCPKCLELANKGINAILERVKRGDERIWLDEQEMNKDG